MRMFVMLFAAFLIVVTMSWEIGWRPAHHLDTRWKAGVLAPQEPIQNDLFREKSWQVEGNTISALASFDANVRVLFTTRYSTQHDHFRLSPIDLIVGWGPMSDSAVIDRIRFAHGYRVVYLQPSPGLDIPFGVLGMSFSHIHAIPASEQIRQILRALKTDDLITLNGYLVSVESPGMLPWTSSLTRDDHGCEIMYIENITVTKSRLSFFEYLSG